MWHWTVSALVSASVSSIRILKIVFTSGLGLVFKHYLTISWRWSYFYALYQYPLPNSLIIKFNLTVFRWEGDRLCKFVKVYRIILVKGDLHYELTFCLLYPNNVFFNNAVHMFIWRLCQKAVFKAGSDDAEAMVHSNHH